MKGRKPIQGKYHKYILTDDAADYIKSKGGSRWLNEIVLTIKATIDGN